MKTLKVYPPLGLGPRSGAGPSCTSEAAPSATPSLACTGLAGGCLVSANLTWVQGHPDLLLWQEAFLKGGKG